MVELTFDSKYNLRPSVVDNDIALLRLTAPITFSDNISPVCVNFNDDPTESQPVSVTGWGTLSSGGSSSNTLQEVQVSIKAQSLPAVQG